ncbi:fungal-specific transcription factor domain-containing protein [Lipomyces arxii]|uniref:fungal-specific transcription factor domain-containing protein n=1 Tax=Lipomyces arxii TaxID=56418 RepID=UPI0034CF5420
MIRHSKVVTDLDCIHQPRNDNVLEKQSKHGLDAINFDGSICYNVSNGIDDQIHDVAAGQAKQRKKAKSRRGLEKLFVCNFPGCQKSFTRLEHLERHQLNHYPKQIFTCIWPSCKKSFVREDLRARHVDRHRKNDFLKQTQTDSSAHVSCPPEEALHGATEELQIFPGLNHGLVNGAFQQSEQTAVKHIDVNIQNEVHHPISHSETLTNSDVSHGSISLEMNLPDSSTLESNNDDDPLEVSYIEKARVPIVSNASPSSADFIDWLFSDAMLSANRDFFVPADINSFLEFPLLDTAQLSTPPQFKHSSAMSEARYLELINFIPSLKDRGDFSLDTIFIYIELYWEKFHFQYPILHKKSFDADNTPFPLLLSIMLIGSTYSGDFDLSVAIAEPLRWIILRSPGFHPPTKIWILQSLLLLEIYEKMMSTRGFHERAFIHHGATLQLIRRGTILQDASLGYLNDTSNNSSWLKWVESESIKRVVFMAFLIDVTHSLLFGHSLLMFPFEIRLSLPCSDEIWNSGNDKREFLGSTATYPFLLGLKRMLNQQTVDVDSFGRKVLFGGLISLSIQMSQQALQVSSIGWDSFRDTWRSTICGAYEFCKDDFINHGTSERCIITEPSGPLIWMMYHMASICINSTRYDLHVFCGDNKVLGRSTSANDYLASKRHMFEWAKTPRASIAAFHSAKALHRVFITGDNSTSTHPSGYLISKDVFVHRPAMIVRCMLTLWAYVYCRKGPESNILQCTVQSRSSWSRKDLECTIVAEGGEAFLKRLNSAASPEELESMEHTQLIVGLLKWVISSLSGSKWDLMTEMLKLLDNCVQLSLGKENIDATEEEMSLL